MTPEEIEIDNLVSAHLKIEEEKMKFIAHVEIRLSEQRQKNEQHPRKACTAREKA